jgi:hypothetical protein
MGLDAFVYKTKTKPDSEVDFDRSSFCDEVMYWRQYHKLHYWMQELYSKKGGKNPNFNGDTLLLTHEDVVQLRNDIENKFLSEDDYSQWQDLDFVEAVIGLLANDYYIFYYSSW